MIGNEINIYELYYRQPQRGEYQFARSVYRPAGGKEARASKGSFNDNRHPKTAQICVINLKLQLDGQVPPRGDDDFVVLEGPEASDFASTLKKKEARTWFRVLFGEGQSFLVPRGASSPVICVPKAHRYRPHKISVHLVEGYTEETTVEIQDPADLHQVINSLKAQIQARHMQNRRRRDESRHHKGGTGHGLGRARSEQATRVLEELFRDFTNRDTPWNRLYAIDRLNDAVWTRPETYLYLATQGKALIKASYERSTDAWNVAFTDPVVRAIETATRVAKRLLPHRYQDGHSVPALEDISNQRALTSTEPVFEVARVLIWPRERLLEQDTLAIAQLHRLFSRTMCFIRHLLQPPRVERTGRGGSPGSPSLERSRRT